MPSKTVEDPAPSKGRRRPNRQRLKKQVTVRIDEDLLQAAQVRAEREDLHLTDAIEAGLWLWLKRHNEETHILRGRFLWNVIPLRLQRLTLSFWSFIYESWGDDKPLERHLRKMFDETLWVYQESDPNYAPRLNRIARSEEKPDLPQ